MTVMRYNEQYSTVITGDTSGFLEYWSGVDYAHPDAHVQFRWAVWTKSVQTIDKQEPCVQPKLSC